MVGEVRSVDPKGESIVIRTNDGVSHTVHVNPDTKVASLHDGVVEVGKGAEAIAKVTADEVKKGTMVAVHYTEKEGKMVASQVKRGSKAIVKEGEVVIQKIDQEGRTITVKTKDGAEHVYEVGKEATIATGNKVAEVGKATGSKIAEGTKATIHFSEQQGQKIIHFLKH
jgi:arginine repressor